MTQLSAHDHSQPHGAHDGHGHAHPAVMTDAGYKAYLDQLAAEPRLRGENVELSQSTAAKLSAPLMAIGLAGLGLTALGAVVSSPVHAMGAFQTGIFTILTPCLGALFLIMIFQILNTHWSVTIRRQAENVAGLIWLPVVLLGVFTVIELVTGGTMLRWIGIDPADDYLLNKKKAFLNPWMLVGGFVLCSVAWLALSGALKGNSVQQDLTGDRSLTRRSRHMAGWGLLVFAATMAINSAHFLMSPDHHFFSTMWPVYIFAGSVMAAVAVLAIALGLLRISGKLNGLVTKEHFHDLGKLLFAFNCFWAYIAFSQYFLIWYSNIPEETNWFAARKGFAWPDGAPTLLAGVLGGRFEGWGLMTYILAFGHFIAPFVVLVSRVPKKSTIGMILASVYLLVFQVLDLAFIVRPFASWQAIEAGSPLTPASWWVDAAAVVGCLALFAGLLVRSMAQSPLVPIRDPRLARCLNHRNWV